MLRTRSAWVLLAACLLAGCGNDGVGALMVDPARYDAYRCDDLAKILKDLIVREKQLRNLMGKADESDAGEVIGTVAYGSDYRTVLEQEKILKHAAEVRKCQFVATYASDQTIR